MKKKRMDTQPRPRLQPRSPYHCSARGLTNPSYDALCWSLSSYIIQRLLDTFDVN